MARHKSGKSKSTGADEQKTEERGPDSKRWTDEAAKARSLDDLRRIPPRDATGLPSSGERYER
ncbi:hypothetical protein [Plantactinospora sonchi]|uniref:DUF3073 domain-containing protein n=1 Tax=Plantactinospora sonchi TaxID=1544735 RepID=A0ABU7S513_9ACTN